MNIKTGESCVFVLRRVFRGDLRTKSGFRARPKCKKPAAFTVSLDAEQNLILGISAFPAGTFWIEIGRTTGIDIFRTIEENPARCFPFPEAWHGVPQIQPDLILNQSAEKAI